ncbi:MAG: class I SAM-dependent methyltransferase [Spirochaetaceae bacterium]|nr:class I SAM-dependent methyltransferase [Spirochaetaceae bacterium]
MGSYRFLWAPSVTPGNGTGHLRRTLEWSAQLLNTCPHASVGIFIKPSEWQNAFYDMAAGIGLDSSCFLHDNRSITSSQWDFVLIDRRATDKSDFRWWSRTGITMIGVDEGGQYRRYFSYLLDTFPLPPRFGQANLIEPGLLSLPAQKKGADTASMTHFQSVLVSFGGEDPAHLTELCTRWLIERGCFAATDITVVLGPLFGPRRLPPEVKVLKAPARLSELLRKYDLVCTSFGLTAYEAAFAGCGVILLNPSSYHRSLSRLAGFSSVGVRRIHSRRFLRLLASPAEVLKSAREAAPQEKCSPGEFLGQLRPPEVRDCPVCGRLSARPVLRSVDRSFFRCSHCGLLYQLDFLRPEQPRYNENYFFDEYRSQYGRSYLEDFEAIKAMGNRRISEIHRLRRKQRVAAASGDNGEAPRLMDVGCAYGPFLSAAYEAGYQPEGIDPAASAVEYVRSELELPAWNVTFEDFELGLKGCQNRYDVISMWFVLEHFPRVDRILCKANLCLKIGGLLAFSTPNSSGISGTRSLKDFLEQSPRDHHTVWSPSIARRVLPRFGFRIRKVRVTGHHPERFPLVGAAAAQHKNERKTVPNAIRQLLLSLFGWVSRWARLGDTFELYAEKVSDISYSIGESDARTD